MASAINGRMSSRWSVCFDSGLRGYIRDANSIQGRTLSTRWIQSERTFSTPSAHSMHCNNGRSRHNRPFVAGGHRGRPATSDITSRHSPRLHPNSMNGEVQKRQVHPQRRHLTQSAETSSGSRSTARRRGPFRQPAVSNIIPTTTARPIGEPMGLLIAPDLDAQDARRDARPCLGVSGTGQSDVHAMAAHLRRALPCLVVRPPSNLEEKVRDSIYTKLQVAF